jgi:hypothetical protein
MLVPPLKGFVPLQPGRFAFAPYHGYTILNGLMIGMANDLVRRRWRYVDQHKTASNHNCAQCPFQDDLLLKAW